MMGKIMTKKNKQVSVNIDDLTNILIAIGNGDRMSTIELKLTSILLPYISDAKALQLVSVQLMDGSGAQYNAPIMERTLNIAAKRKSLSNSDNDICNSVFEAVNCCSISLKSKKEKLTVFSVEQLQDLSAERPDILAYITNIDVHKWFLSKKPWTDNAINDDALVELAKKALSKKDLADYMAYGKTISENNSVWNVA